MADSAANVRVATFKPCRCFKLSYPHLLVDYHYVQLFQGNAIAISYTWGEILPRQDEVIGHEISGKLTKMNLGREWIVSDLIRTLAGVHRAHSRDKGCWIDQLCIPQNKPAERRNAIMQIPYIYRTLKTVALMSGTPCKCLHIIAGLYLAFQQTGLPDLQRAMKVFWDHRRRRCFDLFGISSYFSRLWTYQEFLYSTEISVVWCSGFVAACSRYDGREGVSLFGRHVFYQGIHAGQIAIERLINEGRRFYEACLHTMVLHSQPFRTIRNDFDRVSGVTTFFLGRPSKRLIVQHNKSVDVTHHQLRHFLYELETLSEGRGLRSATEPCDYVAAVWVDCPGYQLPKRYRSIGLPRLLEDAIRQLEKNLSHIKEKKKFSGSIAVSFPSEFSAPLENDELNLWRPTKYLAEARITNSNDVYSSVRRAALIRTRQDKLIEFEIVGESSATALGFFADAYPKLRGPGNAYIMAKELRRALNMVDSGTMFNINCRSYGIGDSSLLDAFTLRPLLGPVTPTSFKQVLEGIDVLTIPPDGPQRFERDLRRWVKSLSHDFACQAFLFGIVCLALGVDAMLCRQRGLSLVKTYKPPFTMGLRNFEDISLNRSQSARQTPRSRLETVELGSMIDINKRDGGGNKYKQYCDIEVTELGDRGTLWDRYRIL